MLRLGRDVQLPCAVCQKPIAAARIRLRPTTKTCSRSKCNPPRKIDDVLEAGQARETRVP